MQRRARKKLETREKIISAAHALFHKKGFDATTMEDVAARADVGIGTLYNYFRSKDRLLLGVFEWATQVLLERARGVQADPGEDALAALGRVLEICLGLAELFDKRVLREMVAASLIRPAAEVEQFAQLDAVLVAAIAQLLGVLQARGGVARELDIEAASIAVYGAAMLPLLLYLGVDSMSLAELKAQAQRQLATLFRGLAPPGAAPPTRTRTGAARPARTKR